LLGVLGHRTTFENHARKWVGIVNAGLFGLLRSIAVTMPTAALMLIGNATTTTRALRRLRLHLATTAALTGKTRRATSSTVLLECERQRRLHRYRNDE
jgi:hypothetical protein